MQRPDATGLTVLRHPLLGDGLPAREQESMFTPQQPLLFSVPSATAAILDFSGKPFSTKMIVNPLNLRELTGSQLLATGKKGNGESILIFGENNQISGFWSLKCMVKPRGIGNKGTLQSPLPQKSQAPLQPQAAGHSLFSLQSKPLSFLQELPFPRHPWTLNLLSRPAAEELSPHPKDQLPPESF